MKVLITGANGVIARCVLQEFSQKWIKDIRLILTSKSKIENNSKHNFDSVVVNLEDIKQSEVLIDKYRPDVLIHLAWDVRSINYLQSQDNNKWLQISKNLIESFVLSGGKRLYCIGTLAEYSPNVEKISISSEKSPRSIYGKNKLHLYNYVRNLNSIDSTWIRLGSVITTNTKRENIFKRILDAMNGDSLLNLPEFCHPYIRDITYGKIIANLIEKNENFLEINLGSHSPISTKEIIEEYMRKFNRNIIYTINKSELNFPLGRKYYLDFNDKSNYSFGFLDSKIEHKQFLDDIVH